METWAISSTVLYKGTFSDEAGHKGPLECELTRLNPTQWHAAFAAANEGTGPNSAFARDAELVGSGPGAEVLLFGEVFMKAGGPYVVRAILTANALTARYERKAGGWPGTFRLTRSVSTPYSKKTDPAL